MTGVLRAARWLAASVVCFAVAGPAAAQSQSFEQWLEGVRREAARKGIGAATLDRALTGVQPIQRVLELDRKQPEFTQTFWAYLDRAVSEERVARGRERLARHAALLERVRARYGVQPRFLVAFWGLESNFGAHTGDFPVIDAVATLAYDARRSDFFRAQLLDALRILDNGDIAPERMKGSWAGAMGQVQFIPTTFTRYAVDFDRDGRRDLWHTLPDVFASAANYLSGIGWSGDETWGREVRLPAGFDLELASLKIRKPLAEWARLGVRRIDGSPLPRADMDAAVLLPAGVQGPAFLVYGNFDAIMRWNRSILYAIAVGHLADRLIGLPKLATARPAQERALSRAQVEELQRLLARIGLNPGEPDGMVGAQTRAALKAYQTQASLAPDGYPTVELLEDLRGRALGPARGQ